MKPPFNARAPSFDAQSIHDTIQRALASAGLTSLPAGLGTLPAGGPAALPTGPSAWRPAARPASGQTLSFSSDAGTRAYRLHLPATRTEEPCPMVVMLHGCTQSAEDFAAGTRMNRLADEHGFLVVYPEQSAQANPSKCWNWFKPEDQRRGGGEPALIAGIVGQVARQHGADPERIYVAGLSAGAAMAVVLGQAYPELFAAVGVHSGLPYGSAHDIPSALAAMKGGRSGLPGLKGLNGAGIRGTALQAVPTIVFHGDRDHTVQPGNAAHIVRQAREAHAAASGRELNASTQAGVAPGGRRFSRDLFCDDGGRVRVESWTLQGAGHAWSGGDASGSYTDAAGPDASAAMLRFFQAQRRAALASSSPASCSDATDRSSGERDSPDRW